MIAFVKGTVAAKEAHALLVNVRDTGYRIFCPLAVIATTSENAEIFLYTHHHVREDEMTLYGFLKKSDLEFFTKLLSVSGIGPRIALDILEVSPHLIITAIEESDVDFLKTLKGIGRKTAERMILELRGNLPPPEGSAAQRIPPEVLQALTDLGFEKNAIHKAFREREGKSAESAEAMVKWFLQQSARS